MIATGCQKKDKNGNTSFNPNLPGACVATITHYAGALDITLENEHHQQLIPVNADLIDNPGYLVGNSVNPQRLISGETLEVELCDASHCKNGIPSPQVAIGHEVVAFISATQAGYTNYKITTTVCQ